jgi:putative membrane protein
MSRPLLIAGAALAAISLAACGQKTDANGAATPAEQAATPNANPAATVPTAADETQAATFVDKAAASDMFEIEAAKLAQTKSSNAEVQAFADMMIKDHTKSTADLKKAIVDSGAAVTPPAALPADMQSKLDALKASATFDKDYVSGQVDAHQQALDLLQRYAQDGDTPAIKAYAAATAPVVQTHLDHAKSLADKIK